MSTHTAASIKQMRFIDSLCKQGYRADDQHDERRSMILNDHGTSRQASRFIDDLLADKKRQEANIWDSIGSPTDDELADCLAGIC